MYKFINHKRAVYHYDSFMNRMKFTINLKFYFLVGFACMFILFLLYYLLDNSIIYFVGMYFVFDFCVVNRDISFNGDML